MFTDKYIKALAVTGRPYRKHEGASDAGFGVQVAAGGTKTFFQQYYGEGSRRRYLRLGTYPDTSLAQARALAREARALIDQGIDPREHYEKLERERKEAERELNMRGTVKQLFDAYLDMLEESGATSYREVRRALYKDGLTGLGADTKAADVTSEEISRTIATVIERGVTTYANRLRAYLHAAFEYGLDEYDPVKRQKDVRFGLHRNPVARVKSNPLAERQGETALDWHEIVLFWQTVGDPYVNTKTGRTRRMNWQVQRVLKLMLALGGQRVVDVLRIQQKRVNLEAGYIELESSETKNKRWHVVPIHPLAQRVIEEVLMFNGSSSTLLFPKMGDPTATAHVSITTVSHELKHWWSAMTTKHAIQRFTPKDLRRTCKTRMGELGIDKAHRDRLQNHALQDVSSRHYDRYDYLAEKRAAVTIWCDHLEQLFAAPTAATTHGQNIDPPKNPEVEA